MIAVGDILVYILSSKHDIVKVDFYTRYLMTASHLSLCHCTPSGHLYLSHDDGDDCYKILEVSYKNNYR